MTMPHLMNCAHSEEWRLDCVKKMHDEWEAVCAERGVRIAELEGAAREMIDSCEDVEKASFYLAKLRATAK